jgi:hypothetical protein
VSSTLAGLGAVHHPPPGRRRPGNQGVRWSAEDDTRLVARDREGTPEKVLMEEFGRARRDILPTDLAVASRCGRTLPA